MSSINVTGADLLADGRVLIVGSANKPLGDDAIAWVETRKQGWKQVKSEAFANRGESGYGSLFPNDVGVGPQAIAMPAGGYSDGESEVHPLRSTSDGEFWAPLISAGAADVEQQGEGTRYRDYRAPLDGDISMNSVSVTRGGFVLGGSRTPAGRGAIPVIWRGDASLSTLPLSTTLPKPRGAYGASVSVQAARGRTIVLAGTTWASAGQPDPGWASWVSRNGGRTWQVGRPVAESRVQVSDLVAVPDGFVALGSTGPSADTDAAVWFSPDGLRWSEVDVELDRARGPGTQSFTSGIVDGDELRLVGYDVPPTGGGPYTTSIPLPAG
ncbi:hypothetical protein [Nocardioides sp. GXZ039]|uniref:hypothetical protein n=1 Tax=Nocardioides sp. GXZ039 TaxID=3136018 RepID=UPI0030F379F1